MEEFTFSPIVWEDISTDVLASATTGLKALCCLPHAGWLSELTSPAMSSHPPQENTTSTKTIVSETHKIVSVSPLAVNNEGAESGD